MYTHFLKSILALTFALSDEKHELQQGPLRPLGQGYGLEPRQNYRGRNDLEITAVIKDEGGWANFLCPRNGVPAPEYENLLAPCALDCMNNHAALGGVCGNLRQGDFNCYCQGHSKILNKESLHCFNESEAYQDVCVVDCQCDHGAISGKCNWDLKSCECIGQGKNILNKGCPAQIPPQLADYIEYKLLAGNQTLQPNQKEFIRSVKAWTEEDPAPYHPHEKTQTLRRY